MVNGVPMRDEHRFREKIELSLEKRHVAGIGIAVSLFLAVAFSLGVLVGTRLAWRAAVPGSIDDLAALTRSRLRGREDRRPARTRRSHRPGTGAGLPAPETRSAVRTWHPPAPSPPST
jgi:hypothetical protein